MQLNVRALAAMVVLMAQCIHSHAQGCTKTVRWFDDAPYSYRDSSGEIRGLNVEITIAAFQRIGCEPVFVELPWARALVELAEGRLDVLPGALRKPEREEFAYFSTPINRSPNVLFIGVKAAKHYRIRELSDLSGTRFRLGAQINVSYGPAYDALMESSEFRSRVSFLTLRRGAWKMIETDRIDGFIADEVTGLIELQELKLSDRISKTRVVVSRDPAMFAFSKKTVSPEFVESFNKAFGQMLTDGRYLKIANRYLPCPVSPRNLGCK